MSVLPKDRCLRCVGVMQFRGSEQIQLGKTGWFLGSLGNLMSGALEVNMYTCQSCGKIELYCNEGAIE